MNAVLTYSIQTDCPTKSDIDVLFWPFQSSFLSFSFQHFNALSANFFLSLFKIRVNRNFHHFLRTSFTKGKIFWPWMLIQQIYAKNRLKLIFCFAFKGYSSPAFFWLEVIACRGHWQKRRRFNMAWISCF